MRKRLWSLLGLTLLIFVITIPVWGAEQPVKKDNGTVLKDQTTEKVQRSTGSWEFKTGDEVISKTQVIEGDLFFSGERLEVDGVIHGDLIAYAGEVVINGQVDGDVIGLVWGSLILGGTVGENLRVLANEVDLNGVVNGRVSVGASQFQTATASRVGAGLLGYFLTSARFNGEIAGPMEIGSMYDVEIGGRIRGDVKASGRQIKWLAPVEITGTVADHSQTPANLAKLSRVKIGKYQYHEPTPTNQFEPFQFQVTMVSFIMFIGGLLLSLIFYRLFPRTAWTISEPSPASFKANFLVGFLGLIGIPLAGLILVFTVVGIPLAIFLALIYILLLSFSWAPVYLWFGRLIFKSRLKPSVMIVFGSLILTPLSWLSYFGIVLQILLTVLGMGMVIRHIKPQYKELINVKA